ncbi:MAG: phage tail tape measure protein, partial [Candidatus Dormibacteria bacterium]
MADRIVRAIITGNSAGAVLAFQETEAAAGKAATSAQTKFGALGTLMQNPWVKAGAAVATVAIGIGAVTTDMAAKFQTSMTLLETGAGEAEANLKGVSDGILAMAPQVGVMPAELASGMYLIESAGYHGAAGLTVLRTAAEGAKVGGADMATVADVLTS